jgi:hypothetical protein
MWAKFLALIAYLFGKSAGEVVQQEADAKATTKALEEREKADDEVVRAGADADRERLRQWSGKS